MKYEKIKNAKQIIEKNSRGYEVILTGIISSNIEIHTQKNGKKFGVFNIICFDDSRNYPKKIKCFGLSEEDAIFLTSIIYSGNSISLQGNVRENKYSKDGEIKRHSNFYYIPKYITVVPIDNKDGINIDFTEEFIKNKNLPPKIENNQKKDEEKEKIDLQQDLELDDNFLGLDF